jgi:hypothetical protein
MKQSVSFDGSSLCTRKFTCLSLGLANFIRDEFFKIFEPRMNEVAALMEEQIDRCREANIDVHVSNSYHSSQE